MKYKVKMVLLQSVKAKFVDYIEKTIERIYSLRFKNNARKSSKDFTRKRTMPFENVVLHMLTTHKTSLQNALEKFFEKTGDTLFMTKQSFSEARHKVNVCAFTDLFEMTVEMAYRSCFETWHGYRLMAIDGTTIALPSDENLREHYGVCGKGNSSATARGSVLYDILNDVIIDAQIAPMATDERTLALLHVDALEALAGIEKELIIFDRGYPSAELIKALTARNVHYLMRVKRKFNCEIDAQTQADGSVILSDGLGFQAATRVIKLALPSGEIETLITNIWDKRMGVKAFKELYFMRWSVELQYDTVKNKLEIENFTGRSVQAIEQDFFATMYLKNIAAVACYEAQIEADKQRADSHNKYDYAINVNHAVGVIKDRFILALLELNPSLRNQKITRILQLLAKSVSEIRPNRTVPRKATTRDSKFHHNKKSNA